MKFTGTHIGKFGSQNLYEIVVDQEDGNALAYTVSEPDLARLNANGKSKWDVKYFATSIREV